MSIKLTQNPCNIPMPMVVAKSPRYQGVLLGDHFIGIDSRSFTECLCCKTWNSSINIDSKTKLCIQTMTITIKQKLHSIKSNDSQQESTSEELSANITSILYKHLYLIWVSSYSIDDQNSMTDTRSHLEQYHHQSSILLSRHKFILDGYLSRINQSLHNSNKCFNPCMSRWMQVSQQNQP